jgi:hypothetical protein
MTSAIIELIPRRGDRIFPYSTDAINAAFTRACKVLAIDDLQFHDLRHEGISRLFEMGRTIPQVASVSGHRSWQSLQRYTHCVRPATSTRNGNGGRHRFTRGTSFTDVGLDLARAPVAREPMANPVPRGATKVPMSRQTYFQRLSHLSRRPKRS